MTKKRQIKTNKRKTGGQIAYIPVLDDFTHALYTYGSKLRSDKINNRMSILPSVNLISNIGSDKFAAHNNPKKWNSIKIEKINFPL